MTVSIDRPQRIDGDASDAVDTDTVDGARAADGVGERPSERQTT